MAEPLWWRTEWLDALARSDMKPLPRFVAYIYAEHAGNKKSSWLTLDRLVERTGMARSTAQKARRDLIVAGWLVERTESLPASRGRVLS